MDKTNVTSKYTRSVKWDISETLGPFKLQQNNQISQDSIVDGERARMVQIERVARPYRRRVREQAWRKLYKNRSSRKTDSRWEKRSSGSPILLEIVSENWFSGKTYFYTIGPYEQAQLPPLPVGHAVFFDRLQQTSFF